MAKCSMISCCCRLADMSICAPPRHGAIPFSKLGPSTDSTVARSTAMFGPSWTIEPPLPGCSLSAARSMPLIPACLSPSPCLGICSQGQTNAPSLSKAAITVRQAFPKSMQRFPSMPSPGKFEETEVVAIGETYSLCYERRRICSCDYLKRAFYLLMNGIQLLSWRKFPPLDAHISLNACHSMKSTTCACLRQISFRAKRGRGAAGWLRRSCWVSTSDSSLEISFSMVKR